MALKKTKTTGRSSESFKREVDQSKFVLDEERSGDLKFIMAQPNRGEKLLQYFLRTGLKYKEVFDAIHIDDLKISEQVAHQNNIAALLKKQGWQGKVDLHTRPVGAHDHPSPHFHLWGSQITKEVYDLVKKYLLENNLTDESRLKTMKLAKFIPKISREDLQAARLSVKQKSVEPTELDVRKRKNVVGKRLEEFVGQLKSRDPKTVAAVDKISQKEAHLSQKIDALKKRFSGETLLVVKPTESKRNAIDSKFEDSVKALRDRISNIKMNLSTNA